MNPSNRGEDDAAKGASGGFVIAVVMPGNDTVVALAN